MVRNHHLELDNLDSPLVSPSPLTSVGGIPGSAIAEKIFNDPDSWELEDGNLGMAWLTEEVEKLKRLSTDGEREVILSMEQSDLILRAFPDHYRVTQAQGSSPSLKRSPLVYEGVKQDASGPLSLSQVKTSTAGDHAGIRDPPRFRQSPSPLSFSPPSSSDGSEDFNTQSRRPSPSPTPPASTTWHFLEWHGIHPESLEKQQVRPAALQRRKPRPRGLLQGSTALHALSQPLTSPPKVPLPPIPTSVPDRPSPAIRRLPAVPPLSDTSKMSTYPETSSPALSHRGSPVPSVIARRPSEPMISTQSVRLFSARRPSEPWSSLPSAIPSGSPVRPPSVRSPPPAGPRPKGFAQRGREFPHRRTASQSPPRTLVTRPRALDL
ncbi:hypothetical protein AX15_001731 [Amanita polypyramis BW_CC]|nr:hypothetical protein AX15_001731 [Amanita polypyramis BW_CC]